MKRDDLLGSISSILPLLGVTALALSISYDFFFLNAIGLNFIAVPTTLSDHVRSGIIWIPIALFALISIFGMSALTSPISTIRAIFFKDESSEEQQVAVRSKLDVFETLARWVVLLVTIFIDFSGGLITAIALVIFTLAWAVKARNKDRIPIRLIFFITVLVGCLGHGSGLMFMAGPISWYVQYASSDEDQSSNIRSIRRFSDFSIIYDDNEFAIVVANSEIKSVRRIEETVLRESYICQLSGSMCRKPNLD